jgi:hypothetical protein
MMDLVIRGRPMQKDIKEHIGAAELVNTMVGAM